MNKINIVTVSNGSYFKFLKVWIYSLYDKVELNNIKNIYIIDTGLNDEQRNFLKIFKKVSIFKTGIESKFTELHGKGWQDSNYSKLPAIKTILKKDKIPTYFIDVDCLFVQDFYRLLDFSKDMVICDTTDRTLACNSRFIGSFYGFNNLKCLKFIDKWYDTILNSTKITTKWRESPSLGICYGKCENKYSFQILDEGNISSSMHSPPKKEKFIFHMKSEGGFGYSTQEERLRMLHVVGRLSRYINREEILSNVQFCIQ